MSHTPGVKCERLLPASGDTSVVIVLKTGCTIAQHAAVQLRTFVEEPTSTADCASRFP